jgi:hypothetical protein
MCAPALPCSHIQELYAVKELSDESCRAAGLPLKGLHAAIYKSYLAK